MRRRDAMFLVGAALGLAGCSSNTYSWNQKLTVSVNTPQGVKTGSAVVRVDASAHGAHFTGNILSRALSGEAAVIKVAEGKYLFALLTGQDELVFRMWPYASSGPDSVQNLKDGLKRYETLRETKPVPKELYPMLVTFADITNPKSVKEVKPAKLSDAFGPGYSLNSITLEITENKVTEDEIEKVLGWLPLLKGRVKPIREPIPTNYIPKPEEELYSNSFKRGN